MADPSTFGRDIIELRGYDFGGEVTRHHGGGSAIRSFGPTAGSSGYTRFSNGTYMDNATGETILDGNFEATLPTNTDLRSISFGNKNGVNGIWSQIISVSAQSRIGAVGSPDFQATFSVGLTRKFNILSGQSGGVDWTFYTGTVISIAENLLYSKEFGTWMGKDVKIRSQLWGGNGVTGGKYSFAKSTSRNVGVLGKALSAYTMYTSYNNWEKGDIDNAVFGGDMVSGLAGIFGGVYGASWSIGWELGKNYGPSTWISPKPQESIILEYLRTNKTGY